MKPQQGLAIGMLILIIALAAVIVGAVTLASNQGRASGTEEKNKLQALAVIGQAENLRQAFDRITGTGVAPELVTFDATSTGMFNISNGGIAKPNLPDTYYEDLSSDTGWFYKKQLSVSGLGTNSPEYLVAVYNLPRSLCRQINHLLHGLPKKFNPGTTATISVWWTTMNVSAIVGSVDASGRDEYCTKDASGAFVYYKVLYIQ